MNVEPFGYLMTLDLYRCKEGICDDIALCYKFLEDIVVKLNMMKQSPPFIFKSDNIQYPDKAGLSGWVPLIESGIQIHTLTPKNFISIDVYSCRKFETADITDFVRGYFAPENVEMNFIERGVKYNGDQ
jgi:S-adenosylmethionine decarboxylase